jgi:hypothetical protein
MVTPPRPQVPGGAKLWARGEDAGARGRKGLGLKFTYLN